MKLLLVDDEAKFINMLAKRLKFRGFFASVAITGKEAIKMAEASQHDVAVLDIKMPGISGLQLKEKLAKIDPALKFIFVTGHGTIDHAETGIPSDNIFLSKPLNIDVLIKTIEKVTGKKSSLSRNPET